MQYLKGRKSVEKDCCNNPKCKSLKQKDVLLKKYNVDNIRKIPGVNEKIIETNLKVYGCENPQQNAEVKAKTERTCLELYGDTNVFGGKSSLRKEINEKQMQGKQGVNGGAFVSKNQLYLANLYNGEVNIQIGKYYLADIFFREEKIYCEYNGSGHNMPVRCGEMTEEEFNRREQVRYFAIKGEGYKQFTIKYEYPHEKLPEDKILLHIKDLAFNYLSKKENNWIVFDIYNKKIVTKHNTYLWDYTNYFYEEII